MSLVGGKASEVDPVDPDLPEHLVAINTGHFTDLIWRMKIPRTVKATAMVLAFHADEDGSNIFPGNDRVADMLNVDESNSTPDIKKLEALGMLYLVRRGGGRWAADAGDDDTQRPSNEYRFTRPVDISVLPLWLDPTMRRYVPKPKRKRKSKADSPDTPAESQAQTPVIDAESQADSPVEPSESQAPAPVIDGECQADPPGIDEPRPVDNSAAAGMTGDPDPNDRCSEAECQAYSPPDLLLPGQDQTPRVVTLGNQLTSGAPDAEPTPRPPSIAAAFLDGGDPDGFTGDHAYDELVAARRTVHNLTDRDLWLITARDTLALRSVEATAATLTMVAAELHRRSLAGTRHPHILIMNGERP